MTEAGSQFQLKTPDSVAADPGAIEMMRFWWSGGEPVMAIRPGFDDPTSFGHILAIAARNIAHVYQQSRGMDEAETYKQIMAGLNQALSGPGYQTIAEPKTASEA